ncbi:MAG: sulfatase [Puniceicoccaceae bacterium]
MYRIVTLIITIFATTSLLQAAEIKNVLFLISDDLKASVLGCYGDQICHTPNIDKLAAEGMVFNRAYCQGLTCGPSRRSFMYSRYMGKEGKTLGEHLQDNGWYTARVGKIFHMRVPGDIIAGTDGEDVPECWTERFNSPGMEAHTPGDYACLNLDIFTTEEEGRQSTQMPHRMFVTVSYQGDGSDQPDFKTADKTIELLREHKDEPFFIAAGMVRPHYPMVQPKQYFDLYPLEDIELPDVVDNDREDIPELGIPKIHNGNNPIGKYPENQKLMWQGYYASVTFMDEQVGKILNELERLGLRDSTAIVFTSDHGYHLGEHTFWQKANMMEEVTRVPLILSVPGYKPGRSDSIVELVDLYPTLSELLGLEAPEEVQGVSLEQVLKNPRVMVKDGAMSFYNGASLREERWVYMLFKDNTEALYDMKNDYAQFTNLAKSPEHRGIKRNMRSKLEARLEQAGIRNIPQKPKKES